jgi:hypothetical protein
MATVELATRKSVENESPAETVEVEASSPAAAIATVRTTLADDDERILSRGVRMIERSHLRLVDDSFVVEALDSESADLDETFAEAGVLGPIAPDGHLREVPREPKL